MPPYRKHLSGARRSGKPLHASRGRPTGPRWQAYSEQLWRRWGPAPLCYYCGHPVLVGEIAHLISPIIAPQLSWDYDNLRPSHGSGRRRCNEQSCQLNCNWLAAVSPDAPKDEDGRDLPFTPEFLARQARESARFRAKRANRSPFPRVTRDTGRGGIPGAGNVARDTPPQDPGREW